MSLLDYVFEFLFRVIPLFWNTDRDGEFYHECAIVIISLAVCFIHFCFSLLSSVVECSRGWILLSRACHMLCASWWYTFAPVYWQQVPSLFQWFDWTVRGLLFHTKNDHNKMKGLSLTRWSKLLWATLVPSRCIVCFCERAFCPI